VYPMTFVTAREGEASPGFSAHRARELTATLRAAIDQWYSHRDVRGVDWDGRFEALRERLEGARTPAAFARAAAEVLRINDDLHVTVEVNDIRIGTGRRNVTPNVNARVLGRIVPDLREFRGGAAGLFEDGIGYLAITTWEGDDDAIAGVLEALEAMHDAPGLIVDVRMNAGGNELLARRFAGCFVDEPTVYSRNLIRDPDAPDGWAGPFERIVTPASNGPRFAGRVAVLMGPVCMSTCESFVLMMREPGTRELFGARTWGSSGNPRPRDIGEGVTVYLSSWRDMTVDGEEIEGRGVAPDHEVEWGGRGRDEVLEAAVKWLRQE
jgi:C-terminal processing protease CtpA/Prc